MIINPCPYCGKEEFQIYANKNKEQIVKCVCGVIYKRRINPDKEVRHYKHGSIWANPFFEKRYKDIAQYLWNKIGQDGKIIDIGCATGRMLERIREKFLVSTLYGVEPSQSLHKTILKSFSNIFLVKGKFDDCELQFSGYDLVLCMGVDYLFLNHDKAMQKIQNIMKPTGKLYIERNVFYGMKSFAGKPIKNNKELYWNNLLITTWFTEEQMEKQLDKYFNRLDKIVYGEPVTRCVGWLCSLK